jgi:hypothetical protein
MQRSSKPIKPKECKMCREQFYPSNSLQRVCSMACALDLAQRDKEKKFKAETREMKKQYQSKDLSWQHAQCKVAFNKLRRLQELKWFSDRGIEPTCISCGNPKGGDIWANGHFKTVGSQGNLRYDPKNCYLQHNKRCNKDLSGDIYGTKTTHGYIQGLKNRFGEEEAQKIIDYCETNTQTVKWTCEQLEAIRKEWNKEIRLLEKLSPPDSV